MTWLEIRAAFSRLGVAVLLLIFVAVFALHQVGDHPEGFTWQCGE
jgi:hypothetical protein